MAPRSLSTGISAFVSTSRYTLRTDTWSIAATCSTVAYVGSSGGRAWFTCLDQLRLKVGHPLVRASGASANVARKAPPFECVEGRANDGRVGGRENGLGI